MKTIKRNKTKSENKSYLIYLLSFFIPIIGMLIVFGINKIYPFGDRSFLRTDLYHQYAPFYAELGHKLKNGGSLFYTWDIGGGTNFLSLIGYYLSSVFNILIAFVPDKFYLEFISYLVIFKMGLAGLTFAILLKNHTTGNEKKIPLFAVFYAMSGYLAAYSWNVMWMDCIWTAPLILLGIEKLIKEKKVILYIVSLGYAILSNYYIAIMLCMFSVLYFFLVIADELANTRTGKKLYTFFARGFLFAFSSILGAGLAGIILIPEIKALGLTASSDITFPKSFTSYFSVLEMLGRHLMNVAIENGLDHWPNIYCGVAVLLCIPLYYMSKKVSLTKKVGNTILVFFMLFSFSMNVPNFIWHGFHYPNSLPCRQSFLYIAIVIIMCYEAMDQADAFCSKNIGYAFGFGAAFILFGQYLFEDDAFETGTFWFSLLFLGIYTIFLLIAANRKKARGIVTTFLLLVVTTEATVNMYNTSVTTINRKDYLNYTESYQDLIGRAFDTTEGFFRFEKVARKTKNDGAFVGYPSLSTFSSVSYGDMSDFYEKLGMESSMNAYSNNGITPLMNSLLGVRYILTTTNQEESQLMTLYEQNEDCYLYNNHYTMSLGYMLPYGMGIDWDLGFSSPIFAQNDFSALCGHEDIFLEIFDCYDDGDEVTIKPPFNCHIFVTIGNDDIDTVTSDKNGTTKKYEKVSRGYLLDLGYCSPEDEISLTTEDDGDMEATAYYVDEDALISLITDLKEEELKVTTWEDTKIEGTIDVEDDGVFFLSIAYGPGWTLYVDGQKTEFYTFEDAFICCDLEEGHHTIKLTYSPDGFTLGLTISVISLLLLILLIIVTRKHDKRKKHAVTVQEEVIKEMTEETEEYEESSEEKEGEEGNE